MGFFDFLSEPPPPLEERIKTVLSKHLHIDERVLSKLAIAQSELSAELAPDEELILITHGDHDYWTNGFGVITNKRVMRFTNKRQSHLPLSEIGDVRGGVHPSGDFIVELIGHAAVPYKGFSSDQLRGRALEICANNSFLISMPKAEIYTEFLDALATARSAITTHKPSSK